MQFAQHSEQYNYTGAVLGGFQESSAGFLTALATVEQKGDVAGKNSYNVQVILTKRGFQAAADGKAASASTYSTPVQLTNYTEGGVHSAGNPYLVKFSNDRFLVLWEIKDKKAGSNYYEVTGTLGYAFVDANGRQQGESGTVQGWLSNCEPIVSGGKAVWYVTNGSTPCFYAFDTNSRTIAAVGSEITAEGKSQSAAETLAGTTTSEEKILAEAKPAEFQQPTGNNNDLTAGKTSTQGAAGGSSATAGGATQGRPLVFTDVTNQWFKPHVDKATAAKLMFGTGSGKFEPQGNLTIAQAMTLAYQIHSKATGGTLPQTSGAWYMPYYQYCKEHGIGETSRFRVSDLSRTCTRFEMVDILDQAIPQSRMTPVKSVAKVPDLAESTANAKNVYKWYRAGIISGNDNGEFMGNKGITRAEVAVILCQINQL